MRTTIDMPDSLYRTLKARAALGGIPLRELIQSLIEAGLRSYVTGQSTEVKGRPAPPVIIPAMGIPIKASSKQLKLVDDAEDLARNARST